MGRIETFLQEVMAKAQIDEAREHAYRPALAQLLESFDPDLSAVNDGAQIRNIGAPDFILLRDKLQISYLEAKDIDVDIRPKKGPNKDQQDRYRRGFDNLVYTNYFDWDFYREGERVASVTIADPLMGL